MYECICGFQAGTALAFQRHLDRACNEGYGPNHRLVLPSTAGRNSPADISGASTRYGGAAAAAARTSGSQPSFMHLGTGRAGSSGGSPDMAEYVRQYVVGGEGPARPHFSAADTAATRAGSRRGSQAGPAAAAAAEPAAAQQRERSSSASPGQRRSGSGRPDSSSPSRQQQGPEGQRKHSASGAAAPKAGAAGAAGKAAAGAAAGSDDPNNPFITPPKPLKVAHAAGDPPDYLQPQPSPEPHLTSPTMMGMMGNAMMSALTSTYSPLRLLRTSPGGGAAGGLEQALRWRHSSSTQEAGEAVTNVSTAHVPMVSDVQGVLLWRDAARSARYCGLGLYLILCLHHLPRGLDYLHPVTALCCVSLLYLVYNVAWRSTAGRRLPPEAHRARSMRMEAALYQQVEGRLVAAASVLASIIASLAVLLHRLLQGRRLGTTFWTVVSLWGLVLLGEARLLGHTGLATLAYTTAFALPWAYVQCRRAMDAFVADSVHWAVSLVLGANRLGAAMAIAAAALILNWGALGLVLRSSLAAAVSLSILAWQNGYSEAEDSAAAALVRHSQEQEQREVRGRAG